MGPKTSELGKARAPASGPTSGATRSKYVSQACKECRRRRAKCAGQRPSCSRCLDRKISCIYTAEEDKRGTAPKSYVRLLQARINLLEQVLAYHSIDVNATISKLMSGEGFSHSLSTEGVNDPPPNINQICEELDGALCFDERSNFDQDGQARYFGSASGRLDFQISQASAGTSRSVPELPSMTMSGFVPDSRLQVGPNNYLDPLGAIVSISNDLATQLIDLYFEWEQPWCQAVDERLFRQSKESGGRYWTPLLNNCILALGSRYIDDPVVRTDLSDPNSAGRAYFEAAEVLLQYDLKWPSITTIQSLAIMAVYYVAIGSDAAGWLHHGMAIRLALDMGLNMDSAKLTGTNRLSPEEVCLRRQIYWCLYNTDKLWASYTGRVCTMLDSQGAVELPAVAHEGDGTNLDVDADTRNRTLLASVHRALSTHCQILEKILQNLYAPKRLRHQDQKASFFNDCHLTLKDWYYALPQNLRIARPAKGNSFPHVYVLNMVYHTSVILLTRPFAPVSRSPSTSDDCQANSQADVKQNAIHLCAEAAREIMILGEKYRQTFGSFRKSPITATHCTLSAILIVLNFCVGKEEKARIDCLNSLAQTLQELSNSWTPARLYHPTVMQMIHERFGTESLLYRAKGDLANANKSQADSLDAGVFDAIGGEGPEGGSITQNSGMELAPGIDSATAVGDQLIPSDVFWSELQPDLDFEALPWDYAIFDVLRSSISDLPRQS